MRLSVEPVMVMGDRHSLEVLLRNLLDNAARYSPADGLIEVVGRKQPDGSVRDQGPGIATALRTRVFDRFYRIPGTQPSGSGLGLSMVKRIAEQHGAQMVVDVGIDGLGAGVGLVFAPMPKSK